MKRAIFWHPDGTPMSAQQFMEMLFGKLPDFFQSLDELRALWSDPAPCSLPLGLSAVKLDAGIKHQGRGSETGGSILDHALTLGPKPRKRSR